MGPDRSFMHRDETFTRRAVLVLVVIGCVVFFLSLQSDSRSHPSEQADASEAGFSKDMKTEARTEKEEQAEQEDLEQSRKRLESLPFRLISILPSSESVTARMKKGSHPTPVTLYGRQALTVVFSRSVIALGQDFRKALPPDKVPFFLRGANIPGKQRWVTTYIARFDPDVEWPTDLQFSLDVNPALTTYDEIPLENPASQSYSTAHLSVRLQGVRSENALNYTGHMWSSPDPDGHRPHEVPPDGRILVGFSNPVNTSMICPALKLVRDWGTRAHDEVPVTCGACHELELAAQTPLRNRQADADTRCVFLALRGGASLAVDTTYRVVLPQEAHYHTLAGPTQSRTVLEVSGLYPFEFVFAKKFIENREKTFYHRFDLWLRHGLSRDVSDSENMARLHACISLSPALPFNLSRPQLGILRLTAEFEPDHRYTLSIDPQKSGVSPEKVPRDGFDLRLQASSLTFYTKPLTSFFLEPDVDYATIEASQFVLSPNKNDSRDPWQVILRGVDRHVKSGDQKRIVATSVGDENLVAALGTMALDRPSSYMKELPGLPSQQLTAPSRPDVSQLHLDLAKLFAPTGLLLKERWDTSQMECSSGDGCHSVLGRSISFLSRTDMGVTVASAAQGEVIVWAASMVDGSPVSGATVVAYAMDSLQSRWETVPPTPGEIIHMVAEGVTGLDGTLALQLPNSPPSESIFLVVTDREASGTLVVVPDVSVFYDSEKSGALYNVLLDRGFYKPGDTVFLKGYMRSIFGTALSIPEGDYKIQVMWKDTHGEAVRIGDPSYSSEVVVHVGEPYGSFSAELVVPPDPTFGARPLTIVNASDKPIYSQTVLVADPRPPTVTLTLSSDDKVYRPESGVKLDLKAETLTGGGVAEAQIKLRWWLDRQEESRSRNRRLPPVDFDSIPQYVPTGAVTGLAWVQRQQEEDSEVGPPEGPSPSGEELIVTGGDGTVSYNLDLSTFLVSAPPSVGDGIRLEATWFGPTGETLTQNLQFPVAVTPWTVQLSLTRDDPLPGFEFGVHTSITDVKDGPVMGERVDLTLYEWAVNERYTLESNGDITPTGRAVQTCPSVSDRGRVATCRFSMPEARKYILVGRAHDGAGQVACTAFPLGKTPDEWREDPLRSIGGLSLVPEKPEYTMGDVVTVSFDNPFDKCSVLLVWGNKFKREKKFVSLPRSGPQNITFPLGEESTGGCSAAVAIFIPRQVGFRLPVPIPISPLFDMGAPRSFHQILHIPIPDKRDLQAEVLMNTSVATPGSTTTFEVALSDLRDGKPVAGEVAVWAVDKALLQLVPVPLVHVGDSFQRHFEGSLLVDDTLKYLFSIEGYRQTVATMLRRLPMDPWIIPHHFALRPESFQRAPVELDDSDFFQSFTCRITSMPAWIPWEDRRIMEMGDEMDSGMMGGGAPMMMKASVRNFSAAADMEDDDEEVVEEKVVDEKGEESEMAHEARGIAESRAPPSQEMPTEGSDVVIVKERTTFVATPLFLPSVVVDHTGRGKINLPLPDNVGTFVIRAYGVDASSRWGSAEKELIVRRPLTLQPVAPRFVRVGDRFEAGVTVTSVDETFTDSVTVDADVTWLTIVQPTGPHLEATVEMKGTTPVRVVFPFLAHIMGVEALVRIRVSHRDHVQDALEVRIPVLSPQAPVFVATSMALEGKEPPTVWDEGMDLPEAVPGSGTLNLTLGVGHLPAVEAFSQGLLQGGRDDCSDKPTGMSLVGALLPVAVLKDYSQGEMRVSSSLYEARERFSEIVHRITTVFTNDALGLMWLPPLSDFEHHRVDCELNAFALWVAARLAGGGTMSLSPELTEQWRRALSNGLVTRAREARQNGHVFASFDDLAEARMVLGADWEAPASGAIREDLSMQRLRDKIDECSVRGKAAAAAIYLDTDTKGKRPNSFVNAILDYIVSQIRVQGRTAYVATSQGSSHAASLETNALALSVLTKGGVHNPLVEKLANFVAQGGIVSGRPWRSICSGTAGLARGSVALGVYDKAKGSHDANVGITVNSGHTLLLKASFKGPWEAPRSGSWPWEELGALPAPLQFTTEGKGEVAVAAGMSFVPRVVLDKPEYRGIQVSKVIQRKDALLGRAAGPPLHRIEAGASVIVTLQMTTPDDLAKVLLVDYSAGGLEPVDANIDRTGLQTSQGGMGSHWGWWRPFFVQGEVLKDQVRVFYSSMYAGAHTFQYEARAVSIGEYVLPPCIASVLLEPEVMGMSAGGTFEVTNEPPVTLACENSCYAIGICDTDTGECICNSGYHGPGCRDLEPVTPSTKGVEKVNHSPVATRVARASNGAARTIPSPLWLILLYLVCVCGVLLWDGRICP